MASLAEIREKLKAQEARSGRAGGDNAIFPHWNIPEGTTATLRFLPDGNPDNTFFWVERLMIRLPFSGVKGDMNSKPVVVQVPCVEMWNEPCPVLTEARTWFKDPSLEDMGRKYWKKRSYVFQGFVTDNPLHEDQTPENPIRRFVISPSIFTLIKDALMDPEIQELPTDYEDGLDFRVTKTTKGQYADYSTSKWARKESALTEVQKAAIDTYGLFNLSDYLPKRPDEVALGVIKAMFESSVDGEAYDAEKFAQYYRPYGVDVPNGSSFTPVTPKADGKGRPFEGSVVPKPAPTTVKEETVTEVNPEATPVETPKTEAGAKSAEDILAMIRSRQKA